MNKLCTLLSYIRPAFPHFKILVCRLESEHYDNLKIILPIPVPTNTSLRTTVERLWRRDFCDGAQLRHADLKKGELLISESFCAIL